MHNLTNESNYYELENKKHVNNNNKVAFVDFKQLDPIEESVSDKKCSSQKKLEFRESIDKIYELIKKMESTDNNIGRNNKTKFTTSIPNHVNKLIPTHSSAAQYNETNASAKVCTSTSSVTSSSEEELLILSNEESSHKIDIPRQPKVFITSKSHSNELLRKYRFHNSDKEKKNGNQLWSIPFKEILPKPILKNIKNEDIHLQKGKENVHAQTQQKYTILKRENLDKIVRKGRYFKVNDEKHGLEMPNKIKLSEGRHNVNKRMAIELTDEEKEARGEAVRGPSLSRLEVLAKPRRVNAKAVERVQQRRDVMLQQQNTTQPTISQQKNKLFEDKIKSPTSRIPNSTRIKDERRPIGSAEYNTRSNVRDASQMNKEQAMVKTATEKDIRTKKPFKKLRHEDVKTYIPLVSKNSEQRDAGNEPTTDELIKLLDTIINVKPFSGKALKTNATNSTMSLESLDKNKEYSLESLNNNKEYSNFNEKQCFINSNNGINKIHMKAPFGQNKGTAKMESNLKVFNTEQKTKAILKKDNKTVLNEMKAPNKLNITEKKDDKQFTPVIDSQDSKLQEKLYSIQETENEIEQIKDNTCLQTQNLKYDLPSKIIPIELKKGKVFTAHKDLVGQDIFDTKIEASTSQNKKTIKVKLSKTDIHPVFMHKNISTFCDSKSTMSLHKLSNFTLSKVPSKNLLIMQAGDATTSFSLNTRSVQKLFCNDFYSAHSLATLSDVADMVNFSSKLSVWDTEPIPKQITTVAYSFTILHKVQNMGTNKTLHLAHHTDYRVIEQPIEYHISAIAEQSFINDAECVENYSDAIKVIEQTEKYSNGIIPKPKNNNEIGSEVELSLNSDKVSSGDLDKTSSLDILFKLLVEIHSITTGKMHVSSIYGILRIEYTQAMELPIIYYLTQTTEIAVLSHTDTDSEKELMLQNIDANSESPISSISKITGITGLSADIVKPIDNVNLASGRKPLMLAPNNLKCKEDCVSNSNMKVRKDVLTSVSVIVIVTVLAIVSYSHVLLV